MTTPSDSSVIRWVLSLCDGTDNSRFFSRQFATFHFYRRVYLDHSDGRNSQQLLATSHALSTRTEHSDIRLLPEIQESEDRWNCSTGGLL